MNRLRWLAGLLPLAVFLPFSGATASPSLFELTGKVVEATTGEAMPGVAVRLLRLDRATTTDADGRFTFANLPEGEHLAGFHYPGYDGLHRDLIVPSAEAIVVRLRPGRAFSEEIAVSATPWAADRLDVAHRVDVVDKEKIQARAGMSLGAAVEDVPGTRNVSTGEQAGTPMIRGMSNNRIRILTDGFAHNYQQFSLRHPPNLETHDYERVEVVRGPSSLLYGPEAMGGVVNLISEPLPTARNQKPRFGGEFLGGYANSNDARTGRAEADGAFGGFGWRASWTRRQAADQQTPNGELPNTGYHQNSQALALGYAFTEKTRLRIAWNRWENEFGFYLPPMPDFTLALANKSTSAELTFPSLAGEWRLSAHHSQNNRRAFPLGRGGPMPVDLELRSRIARAELEHSPLGRMRGWIVAERSTRDNTTRGFEPLVPNFSSTTWSLALFEELRLPAGRESEGWILSGGLRWDTQELLVLPTAGRDDLEGFSRDYSAVTGSLAALYRIAPSVSLGVTVGRGWRSPSEAELFSRGQHSGIYAFEVGNPDLEEESNLATELALTWNGERFRGSASLYHNSFDQHIYEAFTDEVIGGLPVVVYTQADATIEGYEAQVEFNTTQALALFGAFDHLSSRNKATGHKLPAMPPDRAIAGFRLRGPGWKKWHHPFFELRATRFARGRSSGRDELFSREDTEAYTLVDLAAGIHWFTAETDFVFSISISNLTDRSYIAFLDTYKQWREFDALSPGRSVRTTVRVIF